MVAALLAGLCASFLATATADAAQPVASRGGGSAKAYSFEGKVHGIPIHWNKCSPIRWRVSTHLLPKHSVREVKHAIQLVHRASGLRFHYLGKTHQRPFIERRYPGRTQLIIGWLHPRESPPLKGGAAGVGGPQWTSRGQIIKGEVQINAKVSKHLANGFGKGPRNGIQGTEGQLLMHELGHAVGLGHVKDRHQIMYPVLTRKLARWGAGDRNGLVRVGKRRHCF